jgi:hypothetical protein
MATTIDKPGLRRPGFFVCALAWLALPFAATAQVDRTGEYLARMDGDVDGRVSLAEYQAWLSYAFDAMDKDRDGILSVPELPGARGRPVTRDEHLAKLAATFKRQDGNGDGFLSAKELASPPQ